MAGLRLLRKAKPTVECSSPNKHRSSLYANESSPIASTPVALRGTRIADFRHTLSRKATAFSLRSRAKREVKPIFTSSPSIASLPTRVRKSQEKRAGEMSENTEHLSSTPASAPPPVPFSRLKEIANDVPLPSRSPIFSSTYTLNRPAQPPSLPPQPTSTPPQNRGIPQS